jgi:16S rRNA (adenine1518-N6/adenine1519-N6)-dimethyltransferase
MSDQPPPNKGLGQHFLTDRNILGAIADSVDVGIDDTIIEVGPGSGSLTFVLAERARHVVALELDGGLVDLLKSRVSDNVEVYHTDARRVNPAALIGGCGPYKLLGNLPYYAALPILRAFLESDCPPKAAAVLVQREVARQMCAAPGDMSLVSLAVQLFGKPRIARTVRPGSFNPPPKVTSSVVAIDLFDAPAEGVTDTSGFFGLARAGFSAPRKQLRNSLANGLGIPPTDAEAMLGRAGIDPKRRAETLSIAEWAELLKSGSRS